MHKDHEVEFRALIDRATFDALLAKGRAQATKTFKGPLTLIDAYYCAQSVTTFKEIEMDRVGSYSLRLRTERANGSESSSLNTKVIQSEGDHNAWLEHEVSVSSFDEGEKILKAIGFKKFFELRKERYSFNDGDVHVCLEDIADFQPAIEVEIMTTQDATDQAKKDLIAYLSRNGIGQDKIVKKSVTNLLMRERAKF